MAYYVDGFVIPLPKENVGDRSANSEDDGFKAYALRCEAHALRRIQDHRRSLSCLGSIYDAGGKSNLPESEEAAPCRDVKQRIAGFGREEVVSKSDRNPSSRRN